ncbi:glycoside hydrolase family 31 protein [Nonlabens sp. Ci31]|uniref:glycoside hydrolase family 31 protein n=1 Tax=Nonlabens sp. Ci31 TaxID=2608253 RepID=UPI00146396C5|nr:glycoside hydrolase family 31 protein [Nonlabens sp. Ci31]QJP34392.1 glycoside hydrolase family 31 protein [Nonlabens sp. Ci31]
MITNTELHSQGNVFPGKLTSFDHVVDTLTFHADNGVILRVQIFRDSLLRFKYGTGGKLEKDFSYAVEATSNRGYNKLSVVEKKNYYEITTSKIVCHIAKKDLKSRIFDLTGKIICEDELGFHYEESYKYGGEIVKMSKKAQPGESYYGLGDKPADNNLRAKRFEMWGTDQYAFGKHTDPLYKNVPFYVGLQNKIAYGIFFDNTFRSFFDFAQERHHVTSFWAQGGNMDYYFIYGPDVNSVVSGYTELTGKPELPPLWALGFHQCKWSYYPESNVREITSKFRELQIPCDAIYLDIDYMDGFRCFTWDKEKFPNPTKMISDLREEGFKTIAIIDPGIKVDPDYYVYKEAMENDYFCKRADGPYMKGKVWPGECYFPDYTNPKVRTWWADLFKGLIADNGLAGIWNDMNEPAVMEVPNKTFPNDVRHDYDGHPCSHRKAHNIYGAQMARATYEGVKKYIYPKRPFVITRSAYSGTQRYSSSWFGDNIATWEHLSIANIQAQRMALSGMSFAGSDIGGFAEQPTGELFVRWIALGIFHPFCRVHSSGDHGDQEPWTFDEDVTNITRKFIELRYKLLPYLYTAFWQYAEEGTPMLKSLVVYDQEDAQTHYRNDEFIFGDQILVCPILEPNAKGRRMYIPRGEWYNFWTRETITGGKEAWVDADIDEIPLFVKAGSIIPRYPVMQYVGEKKIEFLTLDVYYTIGKEKSVVYEDAADGYDYKKGRFSLRNLSFKGKEKEIIISQYKDGKYAAEYETLRFNFIGLPFEINYVEVDNVKVSLEDLKYDQKTETLYVDKNFAELHIVGK